MQIFGEKLIDKIVNILKSDLRADGHGPLHSWRRQTLTLRFYLQPFAAEIPVSQACRILFLKIFSPSDSFIAQNEGITEDCHINWMCSDGGSIYFCSCFNASCR